MRSNVWADEELELFYEELGSCFPDYPTVYKKIHIDIRKRCDARGDRDCKFYPIYKKVEDEFELKLLSKVAKDALDGNNPSANIIMKDITKRRSSKDALVEVKRKKRGKRKNPTVSLDESSGAALWRGEGEK